MGTRNADRLAEENTVAVLDAKRLMEQHIAPAADPADVRLRESGVPIWAIVGHWRAVDEDGARVAQSYRIPREAVEAALAYYRRHAAVIDARLAANAAA
jgi:uncharacterized protein (DUF433 family)